MYPLDSHTPDQFQQALELSGWSICVLLTLIIFLSAPLIPLIIFVVLPCKLYRYARVFLHGLKSE